MLLIDDDSIIFQCQQKQIGLLFLATVNTSLNCDVSNVLVFLSITDQIQCYFSVCVFNCHNIS